MFFGLIGGGARSTPINGGLNVILLVLTMQIEGRNDGLGCAIMNL